MNVVFFFYLLRVGIEPRRVTTTTLQAVALTTQPSHKRYMSSAGIEPTFYDLEGRRFTN